MAGFNSLNPLTVTKRSSPTKYSTIDTRIPRRRERDLEKHDYSDSDDESDYSSYTSSSPVSSRETSGSYSSNRPMLRRKSSAGSQRPARSRYRLPDRIMRYLCLSL